MTFNIFDILVLVSMSQGFILGLVLLFSRLFKGTHNQYLAYTVLMISIIGMNEWLSDWDFDEVYYVIDILGDDVPWILLVYVPMLWYFLKTTEHPYGKHPYLLIVLSLPFLIFLFLNLYINMDVDFGWISISNVNDFKRSVYIPEYYLAMLYCVLLNIISFWVIRRKSVPSSNKQWLTRIWGFLTALIVCWIILVFVPRGQETANLLFYCLWLGISMFIYWLTYQGLYKFKLAQDQSAIQGLLKKRSAIEPSFQNSPLQEEAAEIFPAKKESKPSSADSIYLEKLDQLIRDEQLYKNPQLSRERIAEQLGISAGYLSQVLNARSDNNFSHYINTFRVEEVKLMLQDPAFDKYNLLAIGREAGFQSKSAFYTTFKKMVGLTPHQFKQQHR